MQKHTAFNYINMEGNGRKRSFTTGALSVYPTGQW